MARPLLAVAALLLVIAIAVIFILPAYDVLPTAMRASRSAHTFFVSLALMATTVAEACSLIAAVSLPMFCAARSSDILNITCTRLC